jgi:hypothetical protein
MIDTISCHLMSGLRHLMDVVKRSICRISGLSNNIVKYKTIETQKTIG